jgi:hypothetical protein
LSENYSEQYDVSAGGIYNSILPITMDYFLFQQLIKTSFSVSNEISSVAFDDFRANRFTVANRLATARGIDVNNPANLDAEGYPVGYGKTTKQFYYQRF